MATMKVCVQKQRKDGFYPVYIRVTHNRGHAFIKTSKMVDASGLSRSGEVTDPYVLKSLNTRIVEWMDRLNRKEIDHWTVQQVADYLKHGDDDLSFSDYCRRHIDRMIDAGHERNAKTYRSALRSLELYAGTTHVMFSRMTAAFLDGWIKSLDRTARAKEQYPVCMRQVFKAAQKELNDEEAGIVRIKFNPWLKVDIPEADRPEKLAITPEECRAFFSAPMPESRFKEPLEELGRDVAMLVLCLGGINTVDLYRLRKEDYRDGIIHYCRSKTKNSRADGAYMEMRVPAIVKPLFEKYRAPADDERLFSFHLRHRTLDSFNANVNGGIHRLCASMGIPKEDRYCVYTFRHTFGTVAQNDCDASVSEVAFAMNHSAGHTVTRGYLKLDFSPAWEVNEKVIEYIFFTDRPSHRAAKAQTEPFSRFSPRQMIRGSVFFRGRILGQIQDIGFNNVEEVIAALVPFVPDDIPDRAMVQFRIENLDKKQSAVYERQKGRGF